MRVQRILEIKITEGKDESNSYQNIKKVSARWWKKAIVLFISKIKN